MFEWSSQNLASAAESMDHGPRLYFVPTVQAAAGGKGMGHVFLAYSGLINTFTFTRFSIPLFCAN